MFSQNKASLSLLLVCLLVSFLSACATAPKPPPKVMINGLAFGPEDCGQYSVVPINRKDHALVDDYIKTFAPKGLGPVLSTQLQAAFVPVEGSLLEKGLFHQGGIAFTDMNADQRTFLKDYLLQCSASKDSRIQNLPVLKTLNWLAAQPESYDQFKRKKQQERERVEAKKAALKKAQEKKEREERAAWKVIRSGSCALRPVNANTGVSFSISQLLGLHVMSLKGSFVTSKLWIDSNKPYRSLYSDALTKKIQSLTGIDYDVAGYEQVDSKTIIPEMIKGKTLHLSFTNNQRHRYTASFSLAGFGRAYHDYETCLKHQ